MSGPRPASMAAVNFGTRSAEVTVSATTLMFGFFFSNSAKSVLSAGPAGSSPKYQLMKRSCTGAWAETGPTSPRASAASPSAPPAHAVLRLACRHAVIRSPSFARMRAPVARAASLQGAGGEAGHQEAGREHVQHDRWHRRHEAGGHQLVPGHAVLPEEVGNAHADRVLLAGVGQDVREDELVPGQQEGVERRGGDAR